MIAALGSTSRRSFFRQPYRDYVLSLSPVAYWRLGEASGTTGSNSVLDISGNGYHGTPTSVTFGSAGAISGDADTAASFNGTSSLVATGRRLAQMGTFTTQLSVIALVNTNSEKWERAVAQWGSGTNVFHLGRAFSAPRYLQFEVSTSGGSAFTNSTVNPGSDGLWYHMAGVYNGTDVRIYVNGSLSGTPTSRTGNLSTPASGEVRIGTSAESSYWSGLLDETAVFNTALTATQILTMYNKGIGQ